MNYFYPRYLALPYLLLFCFIFCVFPSVVHAEGTPNLRSEDGDPVLLFIGNTSFGDFASFDGPENSRLNFRVAEAGETVYFGMSRLYTGSGLPQSFGQYEYRVRSAADNSIVFGPIKVNASIENLSTYEQALAGPQVLDPDGYPVDENSTFVAPAAGEYYIEFEKGTPRRPHYIGLWDVTIVNDGLVKPGRVYSKNWAFRVAEPDPQLPDCSFGSELSTVFYSYTNDGFVTEIDFTDSGFQPLSFNLAFNRTGPGQSGDLSADRRSIPGVNATNNASEHLIFLEEPDPLLFPDGQCGDVMLSGGIRCQANESFCIPITASLPGQAEIILDFNSNGTYDEGLDRLLVYSFSSMDDLEACVPWDGLRADGNRPVDGATVDILVEYTQGVQHWALYDGELMTNGFCVTPIRPICGNAASTPLYYDDTNIPGVPGNGAPKVVLQGCDCSTGNCRTWTDFQANASPTCTIVDNNTSGYGNRNTLNTWWFASTRSRAVFDIPLDLAILEGPEIHCPDAPVVVSLNYGSDNVIQDIQWTGPSGRLTSMDGQRNATVTETGVYSVLVIDEFGCESEGMYNLMDVSCSLNVNILSVECQDNGTETDVSDDVFYVRVRVDGEGAEGYKYNGVTRQYGEEYEIGPFFIMDGDITITAVDNVYDCCQESVPVEAPLPCSNGCAITVANITQTLCSDNNTPTNPDDDLFTFDVIVEGINLSGEWENDRGERGPYNTSVTFGPYPISEGAQVMTIFDSADPECTLGVTVQPPNPCSDECELLPKVSNILCDDNGTPFDPSDDTYSFDMSVSGINTPSVAFSVNGNGAYLYDQTNTFGPFPFAGADFTFVIADLGGNDCELVYTLEELPTPCSDACGIAITDARVVCEDNTTGGFSLYVEVLVENANPSSRGWRARGGIEGTYGQYFRMGTIGAGGETFDITISDYTDDSCFDSRSVTSPLIEVNCPEDVADSDYKMSLQRFGSALTPDSEFGRADIEECWMVNESFSIGRRYFERFTLQRTDSINPEPRLFSFYLYAPVTSDLLGAVFSLAPEESIDCCNLTNDGPVTPAPTNARSVPVLPDSLRPAGMILQQRFSVVLRPGEVYTLLVSSPQPGGIGAFEWSIVSAEQEALIIDRANGPAPQDTFLSISAEFDLLSFEIDGILNNPNSLITFGVPTIDSLCGQTDIAFSDTQDGTCASAQIVRSFDLITADTTLEDICEQRIEFRALGIADISWPESQLSLGCDDEFDQLDNGFPAPLYTGYPFVYRGGQAVPLLQMVDELMTTYEDEAITREDGGTTVRRTWTVLDECRNETASYVQLLKLQNNGAPFFSCPISNHFCPIVEEDIMLWPVDEFGCTADVDIPAPDLNNICDSANWTFLTEVYRHIDGDTIFWLALEEGGDRLLTDVRPGDYLIRYTGSHPLEVISERYCRFRVADLTEPVAICKSTINLSIPGNGQIRVPFRVINQGSYDNCGIETRELRRLILTESGEYVWSEWDEALFFDCSDVGLDLLAEMRVIDSSGNSNFCIATVVVRDNTNPYCIGLEGQSVSCDLLPDGFSPYDTTALRALFGMPDVVDNCSARAVELVPIITGDVCSPDQIRRRFQAVDEHGNLSTGTFIQDIDVTPSLNYSIRFPKDANTDCTDLIDTLRVIGTACDSITMAFVDIDLPVEGEECRFLQRNFVVTNWCEWDGISDPIRIGRDEACNGTEGDAEAWLIRTNDGIFVDADQDLGNNTPGENTIGASCGGINPAGYWRQVTDQPGGRYVYSQRIKIFDTVAPVLGISMLDTVCVDTSFCRALVTVGLDIDDACQRDEGEILIGIDFNNNGEVESSSAETGVLAGEFPNYTYSANLPIGEHRFIFTVSDDCGNTTIEERVFRVTDCYVPFLICRGDRIYNLQPLLEEGDIDNDGIIEEAAALVEATDLARCDFSDCSGDLIFSVNRVGEPYNVNQSSIFLDCEDRYEVYLELYVWDEAFNPFSVQPDGTVGGRNWRRCVVKVRLQDPNLACNSCQVADNITINGNVHTLTGAPMSDVTISAGGDAGNTLTSNFGGYQLGGTIGESYVLRAEKETNPREGLSTLDIIILRRHLLGIQPITNPFLRLVADLNRDGQISLQDVIHLQSLLLAREDLYPAGSLWRFVDSEWDGIGNPTEEVNLTDVAACTFGHDFIGLRLGDLNGSWGADAGAKRGPSASNGSARPTSLQIEAASLVAGSEVSLQVRLPEGPAYAGGQMALAWNADALGFLRHENDGLHGEQNFRYGDGFLWLSWSDALPSETVLTLTFAANTSGQLSDYLHLIDGDNFAGEVYTESLATHPLFLEWTEASQVTTADTPILTELLTKEALLGVLPNPVQSVTHIGVALAEEQQVTLRVTDLNGRVLHQANPNLGMGENWLRLDAQDWPTGVYLFTINTDSGPLTGKILKQ